MQPNEVLERATWLIKSQAERVDLQTEMLRAFQLDWNNDALRGKPDWVQEIRDPQPFNALQWLVDVLAHDEPQIKIEVPEGALPMSMQEAEAFLGQDPMMQEMMGDMDGGGEGIRGQNRQKAQELGDKLERIAKEVFAQNDLRLPTSLQRDELYASLVMGMVVNKTGDMRYNSQKWQKYVGQKRGASPFYIRSQNPANVYFEYDEYGLCEVFHRYLRPLKEVVRVYGGSVLGLDSVKAIEANGQVLFAEYWTHDTRATWVEQIYTSGSDAGYDNYFTAEQVQGGYWLQKPADNKLGFIPYSVKIARGTSIFNRNNMVYPHLYAGWKSKLFTRNNLFFTVAASLAFMLVNPQMIQETDTPEAPVQLDFSRPNVVGVRKGDKITQLPIAITPEFEKVMTLFAQKMEESTVSKVVAGQSPGGVTAAAGINLLIGGGKLTISSVQKALQEVRASTVQTIFDYVRVFPNFAEDGEGAGLEMYARGALQQLGADSLPERMDINVSYQPFLPQDKALAVQTWLTPLLQKVISSDYFLEQVGVQDVVTLREQIEADKDREQADQLYQQQVQAALQQSQQPVMPQEGAPPTGMGGEQTQEQVVGQASANPLPDNANPANELNDMFNAMQNPMQEQ